MVKVCILTNYIMPYRDKLFSSLSEKVDLTVVACQYPSDDGRKDDFSFLNATKYRYIQLDRIKIGKLSLNYNLNQVTFLIKYLKDFDYIIISDNLPNIITSFIFSKIYSLKKGGSPHIILWTEDYSYSSPYLSKKKRLVKDLFLRSIIRNLSGIMVFNEEDHILLSSKFQIPVFFVPQAIMSKEEINKYDMDIKEKRSYVYGYMGYLKSIKNFDLLVDFFNRNIEFKLLVAGGYGKNMPNIEYLGYLKGDKEKDLFFGSIDYLILPSFYDCWGLVVNEAAHRGIPTIVSKFAKVSEVVMKINQNLVFDPYSFTSFEKSLLYSFNISSDEYFSLAKSFKAMFEKYTIDEAVKNFLYMVESLNEKKSFTY